MVKILYIRLVLTLLLLLIISMMRWNGVVEDGQQDTCDSWTKPPYPLVSTDERLASAVSNINQKREREKILTRHVLPRNGGGKTPRRVRLGASVAVGNAAARKRNESQRSTDKQGPQPGSEKDGLSGVQAHAVREVQDDKGGGDLVEEDLAGRGHGRGEETPSAVDAVPIVSVLKKKRKKWQRGRGQRTWLLCLPPRRRSVCRLPAMRRAIGRRCTRRLRSPD